MIRSPLTQAYADVYARNRSSASPSGLSAALHRSALRRPTDPTLSERNGKATLTDTLFKYCIVLYHIFFKNATAIF